MGTRNTRLYFKEMVRIHKSMIFATLETRIHSSNVADFLANMGFTDLYVVEALGYGGWGDLVVMELQYGKGRGFVRT